MSTLSSAIEAGTGFIQTDTALSLGSLPAPITIDSEALLVTADEEGTVYAVSRGENGTARATHALGATVTIGWSGAAAAAPGASEVEVSPAVEGETDVQGALTALAAAVGGPTVLGPYTVNWNTAGIEGDGVGVGSVLPTGSVVLDMRAVITDSWDGDAAGSPAMYLGLGVSAIEAIATYLLDKGSGFPLQTPAAGETAPIRELSALDDPSYQRAWLVTTANQKLWVKSLLTSTQGSAQIYALVKLA